MRLKDPKIFEASNALTMTFPPALLRNGLLQLLLYLTCTCAFVTRSANRIPPRADVTRLFASTPSTRIVEPLTVGPILGATSPTTARIFGRGDSQQSCIGVARIRPENQESFDQECSFRMHPTFDFTGVAVLASLEPKTRYTYQMGFVQLHAGSQLDWLSLDWSRVESHSFCTASASNKDKRSFVFGSCRFHSDNDDDRGDKTFRSMQEQMDDGIQTDAILMLGNQIYARDTELDHIHEHYRRAFTQPHFQSLMARLPTYMMLDKHDFATATVQRDEATLYPVAMHSYLTYQASHSPLFELDDKRRITGTPTKLWYTFQDGCCDFFISDCYTERNIKSRKMMSGRQMTALKEWLSNGAEVVKFVATSIPVFPYSNSQSDTDTWSGFTEQRNELLNYIRDSKIPRVVFLSGNVHCSVSAKLTSKSDPECSILSLVSSSFWYPYPNNTWEPQLEGSLCGCKDEYRIESASEVIRDNNFCRVTATLDEVTFEVFGRKGNKESSVEPLSSQSTTKSMATSTLTKPKAAPSAPNSSAAQVPKRTKATKTAMAKTNLPPTKTSSPPSKTVPGSGFVPGGIPTKSNAKDDDESSKPPWSPTKSSTDYSTSSLPKAPENNVKPAADTKETNLPWSPSPPGSSSPVMKDTNVSPKSTSDKMPPKDQKASNLSWSPSPPKATRASADVSKAGVASQKPSDNKEKATKLPWSPVSSQATGSPPNEANSAPKVDVNATSKTQINEEKSSNLPWSPSPPNKATTSPPSKGAATVSKTEPSESEKTAPKDEKQANLPWSPSPPQPTSSSDKVAETVSKDEAEGKTMPSKKEKNAALPWSPPSSKNNSKPASTPFKPPQIDSKNGKSAGMPWSPSPPKSSSPMSDSKAASTPDVPKSEPNDEQKETPPWSSSPPWARSPSNDGNAASTSIPDPPEDTNSKGEKASNLPWSPSPRQGSSPPKDIGPINGEKWKPPTTTTATDTNSPSVTSPPTDAAIPTVANTLHEEPVPPEDASIPQHQNPPPEGGMIAQDPPPPFVPPEPESYGDGYVSLDNYVYEVGETIEVTYQVFQPREWDYVAMFPASVSENNLHHTNAIQWVNSCENDRNAMNCLGGSARVPFKFPSGRPEKFPLAPGDYNVYFLRLGETDVPNPNEDIIAKTSFKVINSGIQR